MRAVTAVNCDTYIASLIKADITAADGQTTWTFDHVDIKDISTIKWEIPFGGGLGKPSNYNLSLSTSLGFINANIAQFPKATVKLTINVNDELFQTHVGRVRQLKRHGIDPNLLSLTVYDELLDKNPKFPVNAIVDSYTDVHPEVATADFGYPQYYGKHTRPFFHAAVDCDVGQLVGPFNVSSENHVNSVFFNADLKLGPDTTKEHNYLLHKDWAQQSGTSNQVSGGHPFEVIGVGAMDLRWVQLQDSLYRDKDWDIRSHGSVDLTNQGYGVSQAHVDANDDSFSYFGVRLPRSLTVEEITRFNYSTGFSGVSISSHDVLILVSSDNGFNAYTVAGSTAATHGTSVDLSGTAGADLFTTEKKHGYIGARITGSTTGRSTHTFSLSMGAKLKSENYQNYSIFSPQVNCGDIAISENPIQILEDVFNQASITFRQDQSSTTQVDVQSHHFQCYFGEREPIASIVDEFGKITATYLWLGDSGAINMRSYQESGSATVDAIITTSDMLTGFELVENPLGVSKYQTQKAKRVQVNYCYDFQTRLYCGFAQADPNNNSLCDSANASGIGTEIIENTKYIMESDTASYYLGNLVRKSTQNEQFVKMKLPMRYIGLELGDVIDVRHPMFAVTSNLFQIVNVNHSYLKGEIEIEGANLLTLSA